MNKTIEEKVKKIKAIYSKYLEDLAVLKKQQNLIIARFIKKIEKRKMEKFRKLLAK